MGDSFLQIVNESEELMKVKSEFHIYFTQIVNFITSSSLYFIMKKSLPVSFNTTATYRFSLYLSGIVATENARPMLSCKVTENRTFIPRGKLCSLSEFALTGDWQVIVSEDTALT